MDGEEGRRRRIGRQRREVEVVQRDVALGDARPRRGAGQEFARRTQHHGAAAGCEAWQLREKHGRVGPSPWQVRGQPVEVLRDRRECAGRGAQRCLERARRRQPLRGVQRRPGDLAEGGRGQGAERQGQRPPWRGRQIGSQQKTSPDRSSFEKPCASEGSAYSAIASGVQPFSRCTDLIGRIWL